MSEWIEISIPSLRGKEKEYLEECITSNYVSSIGPFTTKFENFISKKIGLNEAGAAATSSGTTALQLGLLSLEVKQNNLVILPTYTFIATANAISHVNAQPWIFDIEMRHLTLDHQKLEYELENNTYQENSFCFHKKTKQKIGCIIPVHVFGCPPNIDEIKRIGAKYNIPILLDSACGIGSKYKNLDLGETGLPGIISFNGNKTITTGSGGIFYSKEKTLIQKVKHLSSTAKSTNRYDHDEIAFNFRMSNIQAALGLAQLEQLDKILNEKKKIHLNYYHAFKNYSQFRLLSDPHWGESSHWLNAIILKEKNKETIEELINKLREAKIRANYFWKPLHLQKPYQSSMINKLKHLDEIQERILILPSSPTLKFDEQQRIIDVIKSYF